MTELQQNFKMISKRMQRLFDEKEHLFHYPPCVVPAWEDIINEMIAKVEDWNDCNPENHHLRFFQIKEKFGHLTVYLEPTNGSGVIETPECIRDEIREMASKANRICRICGAQKVETVHESRVQYRCLDHYETGDRWRIREC